MSGNRNAQRPPAQAPRQDPPAKQRPAHEVRIGAIRAAVWENETENGTRYNVTFSRLYKDDQDRWQDSTSFGRDDLLVLAKVADLAHTWVVDAQAAANDRDR